jgi:orotidine-5'-phosphate decarboxylase
VRTSNPGAAEIQDEPHDDPLRRRLARLVAELGEGRRGSSGLSDVGAVTGATRPELLAELRELMPHSIFLLPGVGAQGGSAHELGPAFAPHPAAGLVAASRSIVDAWEAHGRNPALTAAAAAEELRAQTWAIATGA